MMDPSTYTPDRSFAAKLNRRLTQWRTVAPLPCTPRRAIVSFTFDDFPKSALEYGAEALDRIGANATYYACTGMTGHRNIMGHIHTEDDIAEVLELGHEIGAHTQTHRDCSRLSTDEVLTEIATNIEALDLEHDIQSFAWPYGETHFAAKAAIKNTVQTARGILPGINRKGSDMMQLRSFELTPDEFTIDRAARAIEQAVRKGGWVTIFTHDVRKDPSPFGTTPEKLNRLTKLASDSGARVLTMTDAYEAIMENSPA